jgi:hypothetical protein
VGYRPTDWHVLDLESDPVPGDPERVKGLARRLHAFADDVGDALRQIKGMAEDDALLKWAGKSADVHLRVRGCSEEPAEAEEVLRWPGIAGGVLAGVGEGAGRFEAGAGEGAGGAAGSVDGQYASSVGELRVTTTP